MSENRRAQRRRVLKAGAIRFNGGGALTCTVRNISATGASLEVASPVGVPSKFSLLIEMESRSHPCTVVWRTEKRVGVTFDQTCA